MKKWKQVVVFVLACSFFASTALTSECAYAKIKEDVTIIDGDSGDAMQREEEVTLEEQKEEIISSDNLTDNQKMMALTKLEDIQDLQNQSKKTDEQGINMETYNTYNCILSSVPHYKQELSYWCGPATTKQTLQYFKGYSPSQAEIANSLGTTTDGTVGSNIVNYLNGQNLGYWYTIINPSSQSEMERMTYSALEHYRGPVIVRLRMSTSQGWYYPSSGHYMNLSGEFTTAYGTSYQITDPYITWKRSDCPSGKYPMSATAVYTSTITHFAHQFYM